MAKVYVAGLVDHLFEEITIENIRTDEPFRAARCKACGWIGMALDLPAGLPPHECSGFRERRDPNARPPRVPKVKRAIGR